MLSAYERPLCAMSCRSLMSPFWPACEEWRDLKGVCMGKLHYQPVPLTPRQILTCSAEINSADYLRGLAKPGVGKDAYKYRSSKGTSHVCRRSSRHRPPHALPRCRGRDWKGGSDRARACRGAARSGVPPDAIRLDDANTRIPVPTETGNLIVDLPGRGAMHNQPRIMFMTHMDTVPLCAGAKPKVAGRKIVNQAKTALGGDNRAGCGVLVTLAAELAKQKLDHPPITLLFCVREESGLYGARHVRSSDLGSPVMAFNYDGSSASNVTIGAVGADRWQVEIFGRAAHAGVAPERGISSMMILALALAEVKAGGWFGKVVKGKRQGTSNVGPVTGGEGRPAGDATNVVTDYVHVRGESRSHDAKFFKAITA